MHGRRVRQAAAARHPSASAGASARGSPGCSLAPTDPDRGRGLTLELARRLLPSRLARRGRLRLRRVQQGVQVRIAVVLLAIRIALLLALLLPAPFPGIAAAPAAPQAQAALVKVFIAAAGILPLLLLRVLL
jgi:hypothetical protein